MPSPALLELRVKENEALVVLLAPVLDETNAQAVAQALTDLLKESGPLALRLDFGRVKCLTSTVLGKLIGLMKQVRAAGGHLRLVNVQPPVYEVFQITRLDKLLNVQPKDAA